MLIKPYTKKLLKDLDNVDLWENGAFTIRNKKYGFEVWTSMFHERIICEQNVKFNIVERFLIARKANKIKNIFIKQREKPINQYFQ